ncbi:MAG: GNAT acetyltransferase [bacterium ADurb.Bin429]|nr:MAG: GNAT acetyltransferase [bacterium ADurb.Bin429]
MARNEWGHIVSWAALKCKSDDVWELAVVTDAPYRGRGLARSVVSHATRAALDAGKLPTYLYEVSNTASARVARALGYQFYGYELTCEYGRVTRR